MKKLEELTKLITAFRDERDWKKFHNPKDLAIDISIEAAEVLEHFLWKSKEEIDKYVVDCKEDIADELADVIYGVLLMSHDLNINISDAVEEKLRKTSIKYPVEKSKGKHTKYNKL